jgi:hypothetical protein
MDGHITCQGRVIGQSELCWLRDVVCEHPDWSRHKITKHICSHWQWRTHKGKLKTFAARSLIDKLEQRGHLKLPPIRTACRRNPRPPFPKEFVAPYINSVEETLDKLTPLTIHIPNSNSYENGCVGYYLSRYHYLGFNRTVGQNLKFLIHDRSGRDLACLVFGSAAWKTAPRDAFIGWDPKAREENINHITNNARFLILPWVHVPHLASHILGRVMRRIQRDWIDKYGHPIHMVETFVENDRFTGACYKAANWLYVGQTKGRSRQDRYNDLSVPVKDIYLYPLTRNFRQVLCRGENT